MRIKPISAGLPVEPLIRKAAVNRASAGGPQLDTINLAWGPELLRRTPLLLPTMNNVRALSARLARSLEAAGIHGAPPPEIRLDHATGRIRVSGNHPDAARIEQRLNGDGALAREVRDALAISSHALAIERIASGKAARGDVFLRLDAGGAAVLSGWSGTFPLPPPA